MCTRQPQPTPHSEGRRDASQLTSLKHLFAISLSSVATWEAIARLHPLWYLMVEPRLHQTLDPSSPTLLTKNAHLELPFISESHPSNHWLVPIPSLNIGRRQRVTDSSKHALYHLNCAIPTVLRKLLREPATLNMYICINND